MSGRSAIARKKKTELRPRNGSSHGRPASATSSNQDDIPDFPLPPMPTGAMGPTSPQYVNFQGPMVAQMMDPRYAAQGWGNNMAMHGGAGQPMVMMPDPRYMVQPGPPVDSRVYSSRGRVPPMKADEVSNIEKSGLRSMLDKRSDDVRKGLAKTFAFRKKDREDEVPGARRGSVERPPSAATVRPGTVMGHDDDQSYDKYLLPIQTAQPPMPYQYQHQPLPSPPSPQNPWDTNPIGPPPTTKLPPIPQPTTPTTPTPTIRRWVGAGRPVARWNKLRKDPELWDPNGDVLIFLSRRGQSPRQPPSLRLSSHIIEATESRLLVTMLREGSTEEDIYLPPSPAPYGSHLGLGRDGPLTPPISEEASLRDELEGQISYEMYFPPPTNLNRADQLRHQITTRNVFAVLYHASLVGMSLYQALCDLHTRLDNYMPPDNDNVAQIVKYLSVRGIDDVRSDPATAVSLLAWAESPDVRWEDGWRESFVHCAGMDGELERCPDFKHTTPIARALLERATLETQLRVQAAEERLSDFSYGDMWAAAGAAANGPARGAADRLQEMLQSHYTKTYGSWPPAPLASPRPNSSRESDGDAAEESWLNRTVAMTLQRDFGALYDYLVDRDIVWDVSEARSGRKWMMASESGNMAFDADAPDAPMTDMLIEFDNKLRFPHIPHPHPLIPESIPPSAVAASREGGGLFKYGKRPEPAGAGSRAGAMERRVQLAYTESTNIYALGSDFVQSDLVDAFVRFEKGDRVGEVDPAAARRGRWVLLYGVLQTLASVSVDDARVRYSEGVAYHLGPRLKGTRIPPWKRGGRQRSGSGSNGMGSAAHERSHCWTAPQTWGSSSSVSGRSEAEAEDDEDDGYDDFFGRGGDEAASDGVSSSADRRGATRNMLMGPGSASAGGSRSGSSSGRGARRPARDTPRAGSGRAAAAAGWHGSAPGDAPRGKQSVESFITAL
ncbi:hypothetical protein B0J13DRAFT_61496 [Dactylonectria estremocensis]|uniref:DUF8004 domain-containing protein n=1 Tax=Dactylonectria estremocensis TaxID=1079267 RepID=A0A9P9J2W4_9HYPO|nr:hypothetical protein B0J13DRAFT_61496 [Dactylonectria estremocensis]